MGVVWVEGGLGQDDTVSVEAVVEVALVLLRPVSLVQKPVVVKEVGRVVVHRLEIRKNKKVRFLNGDLIHHRVRGSIWKRSADENPSQDIKYQTFHWLSYMAPCSVFLLIER